MPPRRIAMNVIEEVLRTRHAYGRLLHEIGCARARSTACCSPRSWRV